MRDKNPDMVAGEKKKFVMRPPQVNISLKKKSLKGIHFEEEQLSLLALCVMHSLQVVRVGSKKTAFANFSEIAKMLHRQPKVQNLAVFISSFVEITFRDFICSFQHLLAFLFAELGTSGAIDGSNQLIMKGNSGIFLVFLSGSKKYLGRYAEN